MLCATAASPAGHGGERAPLRRGGAAIANASDGEARVIVKYKADSSLLRGPSITGGASLPQHAQTLAARLGMSLSDGRPIGGRAQVVKARGMSSRDLAERLAAQSDVEYAVVDGRMRALATPNDPLYATASPGPVVGQWYLRAPTSATIVDATSVLSSINAEAAWDVTTGNSSVVVAVLDTGVRLDHPDLANKLLPGYDFVSVTGTAADGDGRDADPSDPGDYVTQADVNSGLAGCTQSDVGWPSSWHGTQTAGLVGAATNNGVGMAGSGRDVMVLPIRVLGKCGGYDSDIQAAMLWAGGLSSTPVANPHPAKVINLSLGSTVACSQAYRDVVAQLNAAGVVTVAAAGNDGLKVGSPANCPGVIGVAGVRHAGTKVGYSDLGPELSIAAPAGNCVNFTGACLYPLLTTSNSGTTTPVPGAAGAVYTNGTDNVSLGTSFSAPLVSGTVGLMFSANPTLTSAQVKAALQSSARPFPSSGALPIDEDNGTSSPVVACTAPTAVAQSKECYCTTSTCGAGLLDAAAAVAAVATVTANIAVASTSVEVGASVVLDGSGSRPSTLGSMITSYSWAITSGSPVAAFTSATNASTATLATRAPGTVVVSLTVADSDGRQATNSVTLAVGVPAVVTPTPGAGGGGGGGGGGAMERFWLLGWLATVLAVWRVTPRPRPD
jgi:serine protease